MNLRSLCFLLCKTRIRKCPQGNNTLSDCSTEIQAGLTEQKALSSPCSFADEQCVLLLIRIVHVRDDFLRMTPIAVMIRVGPTNSEFVGL